MQRFRNVTTLVVTQPAVTSEATQNISLRVYPNPSNGVFTLQLDEIKTDKAAVSIVDIKGKVINTKKVQGLLKTHRISFDLKNIAAGMYMIRVVSEDGVQTTPVIIAH